MEDEYFVDYKDCSDYKIGSKGTIIGKTKVHLKQTDNGNGYKFVNLYFNNKSNKKYVHRLVAESFLENPNNLRCVNHKDEDKKNNNVFNLKWCDHLYNNNYGTKRDKISKSLSGVNINSPNTSKEIAKKDLFTGKIIEIFPSSKEASRVTKISQGCISLCANKKRGSAGGFMWEYTSK